MIEILITGSLVVLSESESIRDGYVFVKSGRVVDAGSGTPPLDYTYAHLVLGGEGRVVAPALTAVVDAPAYPWRLSSPSLRDRIEIYRSLSASEALTASLPAVYEAHVFGVGRVIVEYTRAQLPMDLASSVGGVYGLAYPACEGEPPRSEGIGIITVADDSCGGGADIVYDAPEAPLHMVSRPVYAPRHPRPLEASSRLRSLLGLPPSRIKEGDVAEIAVFDFSRPPGMFLYEVNAEDAASIIYSLGVRVESLIVAESVLVDQREHLYITAKQFSEARRLKAGRR